MSAGEALSNKQFNDSKFPHPDDAAFVLARQGRWRGRLSPVPHDYNGNPQTLPEGVYDMPTKHLRVTDPDRVRKKSGSALEQKIAKEGIRTPVHLSGRSNELVDGNHRVSVAINLGLPTVPTLVSHMTPERMQRWR